MTDNNATYILDINASSTANFNLLGYAGQGHSNTAQLTSNSNALGLLSGTVRINANVVVNQLSNTGNYNISERARLWVNGGEVHKTLGSSTVPYGTVRVSSGILESDVTSGVTIRDDGQIIVEGGQLLTRQIRTSVLGASNVGGYTQTGGDVVLDGTGGTQGDYSMFSMTYSQNVFSMAGGTITIRNSTGKGHIFINSDSYNVTGGTVTIEIGSTSQYKIDSKAPLYNLTLQKTSTSASGMEVELGTITGEGSEDESVGATNTVLPVEFLSFKATAKEQSVELVWETASEINNDYFEVLRSVDGIDFKKIGEVAGAGNSSKRLRYAFVDKLPVAGVAYYQLKQVDYNGMYEYSDKVSVEWTSTGEYAAFIELNLYPNPAPQGEAKLRVTGLQPRSTATVKLLDMFGKVHLQQVIEAERLSEEGYMIRTRARLSAGV